MATRVKTVHHSFAAVQSSTNNTLQQHTQTTIYLPESSKVFKSVVAHLTCDDIVTATGGSLTTKTLSMQIGSSGYTTVSNANTLTHGAENHSFRLTADFTSLFTASWSGTSMTADFQSTINQSTGTTLGMRNLCVTLEITYEYDDTSATQIKTVFLPLDAPVTTLPTSATTYCTIPALTTHLPEASKVFRNIHVVLQGNTHTLASTTDHTVTLTVGSATVTTQTYEQGLASDRFYRYVWDVTSAYPDTAATQVFRLHCTTGTRHHHQQAYLVVTYEYSETNSTSIFNSLMLPVVQTSPMGGASTNPVRLRSEFYVEEPATIATKELAAYLFWTQFGDIGGLNMRLGTGSYVAYTDIAANVSGSNAAMCRKDDAITIARGENTLTCDIYRSDATDFGWGLSGFFIVNYTSGKSASGSGAHNKTVFMGLLAHGTAAIDAGRTASAIVPPLPETDYFLNSVGLRSVFTASSTTFPSAVIIQAERLSGEDGLSYETALHHTISSDNKAGYFHFFGDALRLFLKYPGDKQTYRPMDFEASRAWAHWNPLSTASTGTGWQASSLIYTYHSIKFTVAADITNSAGGTVTINLVDATTGKRLKQTSRSGNGAFSFDWYDNVDQVFVEAYESSTKLGRSVNDVAAGSP